MARPDKIRQPAVAGKFYPLSAEALKDQIEGFLHKEADKKDVIACMLPHAGYVYSGMVAAETVSRVNVKEKIILLGPNHTGYGAKYSVMAEGYWQTPLGRVKIDSALAEDILSRCGDLESDNEAHAYEHSLEVELPFFQYFKPDFEIVPMIFLSDALVELKKIGVATAAAIKERGIKDSVLIVASSDMTHYESQGAAQKKDREAIEAILELNEDKLAERVKRLNISMCGYAPAIVMIAAAKALGAKMGELIKYQTSADVTRDKSSVVGYAGLIIY
jgi:MEMO1 family protein